MLGTQTLLGLAVDEFGIVAAEVCVRPGGRPETRRAGFFAFDEKLNADNTKELGRKFGQFLRANHFSAKRTVVGIPAKWIAAKEVTTPPAAPDALASMLSIQAERAFSLNAGELVFDYCAGAGTSEKGEVLLIAAPRQTISQLKELADAAGLQVRCVTVSALAFGKVLSQAGPEERYGLYVRPTYCEFWSQSNGGPRSVKHVCLAGAGTTAGDQADLLTSAIQRLVLLSSQENQSPPYQVTVYDGGSLSDGMIDRLSEKLAPEITVSDGNTVLLSKGLRPLDGHTGVQSVAAVALALTAADGDRVAVDFLNPRIGRKKTPGRSRLVTWAVVAGVVAIAGVGAVVAGWHSKSADIAACTRQLEEISGQVTAAREMVDRISYAGSWTSQKPEFLECLRQLTLAFPESPRVWATSLALSENAEGSLVGKAVDEKSFYEVLDNIKQNSAFSGVMMMYLRDAGSSSREKEFAVTFKFQG